MPRIEPQRTLPDPLLSVTETAAFWGCSTDTVEHMILTGRLPAVRIGPRMIRVRLADAEALLVPLEPHTEGVAS